MVRWINCRKFVRPLIPTALTIDRSPRSGCDRSDAVVVVCEECPGVAGLVENVVVTVEDGDREFIATQIFPDVFDRVEFWRVGRQRDERDVVWDGEIFGDVITGAIEDEGGVAARHDPPTDLRQMQGHDLGVGGWDDESRRGTALRTDGAEDVGPFVALIARRTRPCSSLGPDAGQRPLLTDSSLVLEPDFDGFVFRAVGEPRRDRCGKVFLNASWASSSVWG